MGIPSFFRAFAVCAFLPSMPSAHEFWIEPLTWQVPAGGEIVAHLRNGENMEGSALSWYDRSIARADIIDPGAARAFEARNGDRPALRATDVADGLNILLHETAASTITYATWEKFAKFNAHKDLGIEKSAHLAAGHPETGFTESYTRHVKSLVGAGSAIGQDSAFGMEIEIVALTNPYDPDFKGLMQISLLYQDTPRADAQIEIFERAPSGKVTTRLAKTNTSGQASISVRPGFDYLFDAVLLRDSTREGAIYDTLWAALTFHVPAPQQ